MDYIYGSIDAGNIDYTGLSSDTADILVDNEARTIKCNVHDDAGFDIRKTLPKDEQGKYITGDYKLTVTIMNNVPTFVWTPVGEGHVYYGVTDADVVSSFIVTSLTDIGSGKQTFELVFEPVKQKSVFAYPQAFGRLSSIRHKETGLEVLSGWNITTTQVNDTPYYVYSTTKSTGEYTYIFTF